MYGVNVGKQKTKLGFNAAWSMAVGGMIGGGIFSTLGVVVGIAGAWAWMSFVVAGLIAMAAGYSYVKLADLYGEGGGAFTFLRDSNAPEIAGSISWILIVGYVLTNAVYAFTFGQYLGNVVGLGPWFPRFTGFSIVAFFIVINLQSVSEAGGVEIFLVWFKLVALLGLAGLGLSHWAPSMLSSGVQDSGIAAALFGAASVFMAYEGFQLLTYDYEDIANPRRVLPRAVLSAILIVIITYVVVALGTAMLIGSDSIIQYKEVALAVAGQHALGTFGLIVVTIAAAFSTGSAINATLFATARLAHKVAEDGELPETFDHRNRKGIPDRAVIGLGAVAAVFAALGTLATLVEAASLTFLFTFAAVCGLAFLHKAGSRLVTGFGAVTAVSAAVVLVVRLMSNDPAALIFLLILVLVAMFGRPVILRHIKAEKSR
jgi:amino acid transporter